MVAVREGWSMNETAIILGLLGYILGMLTALMMLGPKKQ